MSGMMDETTKQDMDKIYSKPVTNRTSSKKPNKSNKPKRMNSIANARATMRKAFKKDKSFHHGYVSNIAMLLHDRYGNGNYITNSKKRNQAAEDILKLIFN